MEVQTGVSDAVIVLGVESMSNAPLYSHDGRRGSVSGRPVPGLTPVLRLRSCAVAGVDPLHFGIGPVPAANLTLACAGISFDDLDVIELNEACAVQVLACLADCGIDTADPRLKLRSAHLQAVEAQIPGSLRKFERAHKSSSKF
jgi:acetyl-CoA acetyltransferase